ncbi:hypothetical protein [Ferrimonas balearica]|uniref:hypothetical protein n=1 Tax=Ferrimonas balearica TaxID=44012 RepID=UPI001C9A1403|nr:hypothetical protein [Ferrimonas balearica]MBY5923097.1 hypothetical protein [Ferrimonas balearica]MBY5997527.1 hypothetical protein [Ferrimonas balearica]
MKDLDEFAGSGAGWEGQRQGVWVWFLPSHSDNRIGQQVCAIAIIGISSATECAYLKPKKNASGEVLTFFLG